MMHLDPPCMACCERNWYERLVDLPAESLDQTHANAKANARSRFITDLCVVVVMCATYASHALALAVVFARSHAMLMLHPKRAKICPAGQCPMCISYAPHRTNNSYVYRCEQSVYAMGMPKSGAKVQKLSSRNGTHSLTH